MRGCTNNSLSFYTRNYNEGSTYLWPWGDENQQVPVNMLPSVYKCLMVIRHMPVPSPNVLAKVCPRCQVEGMSLPHCSEPSDFILKLASVDKQEGMLPT